MEPRSDASGAVRNAEALARDTANAVRNAGALVSNASDAVRDMGALVRNAGAHVFYFYAVALLFVSGPSNFALGSLIFVRRLEFLPNSAGASEHSFATMPQRWITVVRGWGVE